SSRRYTGSFYPGYSWLVAFYEDFNEHYYLLRQECLDTARAIVERALSQPGWLAQVIEEIRRWSDRLAAIFPPDTSASALASLPLAELLALYELHAEVHQALYYWARLPEALDRGVGYFSGYLLDHLRSRGLTATEAEDAFAVLTQPVVPSVLAQEILDFDEIVQQAEAEAAGVASLHVNPARVRMLLPPALLRHLKAHREKWQFLSYHGYGRREPASVGHY